MTLVISPQQNAGLSAGEAIVMGGGDGGSGALDEPLRPQATAAGGEGALRAINLVGGKPLAAATGGARREGEGAQPAAMTGERR